MAYLKLPERVYFGEGALKDAIEQIKKLGTHACIVTGPHVGSSIIYEKLIKVLKEAKLSYDTFSRITGEPTTQMITQGCMFYKEHYCDFIIGIGGGSPLDAAKAIGAMLANDGDISDYMGVEIEGNIPNIVAIPTTAGTGSEATKMTIITDTETNVKMLLKGEVLIPKIAVIDPTFTLGMPKNVIAATGLDALTHAVEAYTSKNASILTDVYAISAIKRIFEYLPIAYEEETNMIAKEQMAMAAYEAGVCINNSGVTLVHGMSRPIGGMFHVPHGLSNAMLLKDCLLFAIDGALEQFAILAREINVATKEDSNQVAAANFLDAIERLCKQCEVPTLKEYGVKENEFMDAIEKMATDAMNSGSPANTRKKVTKEDCMELYKRIYKN